MFTLVKSIIVGIVVSVSAGCVYDKIVGNKNNAVLSAFRRLKDKIKNGIKKKEN